MADQDQPKATRRARRRAEKAADEGTADSPSPEAGEPSSEAGAQGEVAASTTEQIRAENRRARRAAAAKRRAKRERERERSAAVGLDTGEMVDDAMARGIDSTVRWVRRHFNVIQWVIVLSLGGWIGWEIYSWRSNKSAAQASDQLLDALRATQGRVGAVEGDDPSAGQDVRRVFSSDKERQKAALEEFQQVAAEHGGSTLGLLAKLGLAGALYDQGQYAEALEAYEEVYRSELSELDADAKARSLEGMGLSLEAAGKKDEALKRFKELANAEVSGFWELGLYHQARILHDKGDEAKAKELLVKILEKYKEKGSSAPGFVAQAARDLLTSIDPEAVPAPSADEALKKALEQLQKDLPEGASVPVLPQPAPAPAPAP